MQIVRELLEFLWAVINSWAGYVTGGLAVAIVWLWSSIKQTAPSRNFAMGLALFFLFCAFFNAWREQKRKVGEFQARFASPDLKGDFGSFYTFTKEDQLWIMVGGNITNPHGPPSALLRWSMRVKLDSGTVYEGTTPMSTGKDVVLGSITAPIAKYLPFVTTNPIPAGGAVEGWYWSVFTGLTSKDIQDKKGIAYVEFSDVVGGASHTFQVDISRTGIYVAPRF